MCLSLAGRIVELCGAGRAVVEVDGRPKEVSLAVLVLEPEQPQVGDWVLIHSGLVVGRLEEHEAREIVDLHRAVHAAGDDGGNR